jgi:hypothetical protein
LFGRNCIDLNPAEEVLLGRTYNCSSCPAGYNITADEKCEGKTFNSDKTEIMLFSNTDIPEFNFTLNERTIRITN